MPRLAALAIPAMLLALAPARGDDLFPSAPRRAVSPSTPPVENGPKVAFDKVEPVMRAKLRYVMDAPSLSGKGPAETFNAEAPLYRWLLANPDLAVRLWKAIGAKVSEIDGRDGRYRYTDDKGSEVYWGIAHQAPGTHVWYAEGKVRPAILCPLTSFKAVVVMHWVSGKDAEGRPAVKHQVHFQVRSDSKAIALVLRGLGKAAPTMIETYLGQLQTFYGGMAWYLGQDEARTRRLYREVGLPVAARNPE
jgi:hypothetical protein